MRTEFVRALCSLARIDHRVVLMTADLGFGALEPFAEEFPDRYFNVGVAEQGMVAAATGLAEAGFVPYCYSIATFSSLRIVEFFRNGPVAHRLPVRIVGIGAGMDYGLDGLTHFAIDDVAMYFSQPGVHVWAPASPQEVTDSFNEVNQVDKPVYIRLVRRGTNSDVPNLGASKTGSADVRVLSLGDAHVRGSRIAELVSSDGYEVDHRVVTRVDSFGKDTYSGYLRGAKCCVVVENHYVFGGLASHVAHEIARNGLGCAIVPVGVECLPMGKYGDQTYMESQFTTTDESAADAVRQIMNAR